MFVALSLQTKYGKDGDLNVYNLVHNSVDDYYRMYNETLADNLDQVNYVVDQIMQNWLPESNGLDVQRCNSKVCEYFVQITGLSAKQFYIYNTFLDLVADNMISTVDGNVPTMGFSLTILDNFPHSHDVYIQLQKLVIEVQSTGDFNNYTALTFAGYYGYFFLSHAGAHAMIGLTQDYGYLYEVPDYDADVFFNNTQSIATKMQKGFVSAQQRLVDYCQDSVIASYGNIYDYILPYRGNLPYTSDMLISYQEYQNSDKNGQYSCNESSGYKKTTEQSKTIFNVQTSLRYNQTTYLDSDFRMVTQERNFNSSSIDEETSTIYPSRAATTMAIVSAGLDDISNEKSKFETCTSVYDASNSVVSCQSKPPAESAASISCSVIIIVATIAFWVWGCYNEKKMHQLEQLSKLDDEL